MRNLIVILILISRCLYRTQKLPDDIPIKKSENPEPLNAIGEEIEENTERATRSNLSQQQQSSQNQSHLTSVKSTAKDNLNGFTLSKHSKEKEKEKKDKKKKRTKSSNQDDVNMQLLSASMSEPAGTDRALFKIGSQTKSNQHLNNDFLLESLKLINEPNERKSNLTSKNSDGLNEEKIPLV